VLSTFFEWLGCLGVFTLFTPNHPVPVLVSLLSPEIDLAIDRRSLVFRSEMGVPHDHLECPVPEQLCNRPQIDPGHNKSTGKRMAVAMPRFKGGTEGTTGTVTKPSRIKFNRYIYRPFGRVAGPSKRLGALWSSYFKAWVRC